MTPEELYKLTPLMAQNLKLAAMLIERFQEQYDFNMNVHLVQAKKAITNIANQLEKP